MGDEDRIVIHIILDEDDVKAAFDKVGKEGQATAEDLEASFNESLANINAESLKQINENLIEINKTIKDGSKAQDSFADDVGKTTQFFADLTEIIGTVADNFDVILLVMTKVNKVSKSLSDKIKDAAEAFQKFKLDKTVDNLEDLIKSVTELVGETGFLKEAILFLSPAILSIFGGFETLKFVLKTLDLDFKKLGISIAKAGGIIFAFTRAGKDIIKTGIGISQVLFGNIKRVFGLTAAMAGAAVGLGVVGETLKKSNNEFVKMSGVLTATAAILLAGFAGAITFAIVKIGSLAFEVGTNLVSAFQDVTNVFIAADSQLVIFTKTIEVFDRVTGNVRSTTGEWAEVVATLSDELNLSVIALQKAGGEIIQVGSRLGLATEQQQKLLRVVSEFAKITGKDVFNASVAFVSALNGNAQAVTAFGVKLSEASNKQFLLKEGIELNFRTISEGAKTQIRFNNLLSQYKDIAGLAAATTGTLAAQGDRLVINQEKLATSLGKGAALIEANNIGAASLNIVLNNVNDTVVELAGFFGALGSRILQIAGFLLKLSFTIFAVVKGMQILNLLLASSTVQSAFGKSIPLLGISFNKLLFSVAGTNVALRSTGDILKLIVTIAKRQLIILPQILGSIIAKVGALLLAFAPLLITIGLIAGAVFLLVKAFKEIEKRTQVFSSLSTILFDELKNGNSVLSDLEGLFNTLGSFLKDTFNKVIGATVFAISGLIQLFAKLALANPFGLLSKKSVTAIAALDDRLAKLNKKLLENNFSLLTFGKTSLASGEEAATGLNILGEAIRSLQQELVNILTDEQKLELIAEQEAARLELIELARQQDLISLEAFEDLKTKITMDAENQRAALRKKGITDQQKSANAIFKGIQRSVVGTLSLVGQAIGASLVKGKEAFSKLGGDILNLIGNQAIQIGEVLIGVGLGMEAIRDSILGLTGGPALFAGLALVALGSLLTSLSGGGGGVTAQGAGVAGPGDTGAPTIDPDEFDDDEEFERGTRVTVNVEGTILDPVGTATQIAELLSDIVDSNDIVVNA